MGLHALGDSAWLFKADASSPEKKLELILRLRRILRKNPIPEIVDIVSSFDTIAVHFKPTDGQQVYNHITSLQLDDPTTPHTSEGKTVTIPVAYHTDLQPLAEATNLTAPELTTLHRNAEYTVAAIGFSPGFPYLQGLPPQLHHPRLPTPQKVPAGSVAIAGDQAGIYPFASQGGWHILGQNQSHPLRSPPRKPLPSPARRQSPLRGNRHPPRNQTHPTKDKTPPRRHHRHRARRPHLHPGSRPLGQTTPRHLTRRRRRSRPRLHRKPPRRQPRRRSPHRMYHDRRAFSSSPRKTKVAWVGWADETSGKPHKIKAGQTIDLRTRMCHLRGYIAIAGGIDVPQILGSRATDLRATLGGHQGRTLQAGDTLPIGKTPTTPISKKWHVTWPRPEEKIIELRYLPGLQENWFTQHSLHAPHRKLLRNLPHLRPHRHPPQRRQTQAQRTPRTHLPTRHRRLHPSPPKRPTHRPHERTPNHRRLPPDRPHHLRRHPKTRPRLARHQNHLPPSRSRNRPPSLERPSNAT